jgi:hypothetical protein
LQRRNLLAVRARLDWSAERVVHLLEACVAHIGAGVACRGGIHTRRARQPDHRRLGGLPGSGEGDLVTNGKGVEAAVALLHDEFARAVWAGIAPGGQLERIHLREIGITDEVYADATFGVAGLPAGAQK